MAKIHVILTQDMNINLDYHSSHDVDLVTLAGLANELPHRDRQIPYQRGVAVLGNPNEVLLDLVFYVATWRYSMTAGINQLLAECCPPKRRGLNLFLKNQNSCHINAQST